MVIKLLVIHMKGRDLGILCRKEMAREEQLEVIHNVRVSSLDLTLLLYKM